MRRCSPISSAALPISMRCNGSGARSATVPRRRHASASGLAFSTRRGRLIKAGRTAASFCRSPATIPRICRFRASPIPLASSRRRRRAAISRSWRSAAGALSALTLPATAKRVSRRSAALSRRPCNRSRSMDVPVVDRSNRRQTQTPAHQAPPCTLVIFGAGGDLTKRLLMPAIYNLSKAKLLSDKFAIIAVDRTPKPIDAYRDYLAEGIRSFVSDTAAGPATEPFDAQAWEFVATRISHFAGDLTQSDTYARLHDTLEKTAAQHQTGGNAVFYLAVAAQLFGTIVEQLGAAGLAREQNSSFRRVIIEKPFGTDLGSARALNARILKVLAESQIYRMDHFLGKETVQNIMVLRFANGIFEPIWNRDHIDHVQITVAETVGVELRARFYEQTGALRDMVPNHVFQLLSMTAMEPPNSFDADAVRTEKHKVLEAVHPLDNEEVRRSV